MKYIKNKEYKLRQISENIYTLESIAQDSNSKIITLNSSAAFIWENIDGSEFCVDDVMNLLIEKYHISGTDAYNDSKDILDVWLKATLIIPYNN